MERGIEVVVWRQVERRRRGVCVRGRYGITGAGALFLQPRLEPVCTELEGVVGLYAEDVAGEVCDEGVKHDDHPRDLPGR